MKKPLVFSILLFFSCEDKKSGATIWMVNNTDSMVYYTFYDRTLESSETIAYEYFNVEPQFIDGIVITSATQPYETDKINMGKYKEFGGYINTVLIEVQGSPHYCRGYVLYFEQYGTATINVYPTYYSDSYPYCEVKASCVEGSP
jgi:hypothetical protein